MSRRVGALLGRRAARLAPTRPVPRGAPLVGDALFNIDLDLGGGESHVVEVQVHLSPILEQKAEAHAYYGFFRKYFHGNMSAVDDCMAILDHVVGSSNFSVRLLERAAESSDVAKLRRLADLFEHKCSQYSIALIFRKRLCAVEVGSASSGRSTNEALACALGELSSLLRKLADYDNADRCARHAVALSRASLANPVEALGPDVASALCELGATFLSTGNLAAANAPLTEALALYDRAYGAAPNAKSKSRPERRGDPGWTLLHLATLRKEEARFVEALAFAERAAATWDAPDAETRLAHAELIKGTILMHLGRNADSRTCFERSLEIRRKAIGVEHPDTAKVFRKLATSRRRLGDLADAAAGYETATSIFVKAYGYHHPDTIKVLCDHAEVKLALDDAKRAEDLLNAAHEPCRSLFGEDLTLGLVRECAAIRAQILSHNGDYDDARTRLQAIVQAEEQLNMPPKYKAAFLINDARALRASGGSQDDVAKLARQAHDILAAIFRPPDEISLARSFFDQPA